MQYVGLTDDHERRRQEHGYPRDWRVVGPFPYEEQARNWEKRMLMSGYEGDTGGRGWMYGYTYTVAPSTRE